MSAETAAFREGQEHAYLVLSGMLEHLRSLSEQDRLQWWSGFLAAAMGAMVESVGEPARKALEELKRTT